VFAEAHRGLVNSRRITFDFDVVSLFPCAGGDPRRGIGMPACADTPVPTAPRAAPRAVWTDYAPVFGTVAFDASALPAQRDAWARTARLQVTTAVAAHSCAYSCLLSSYVAGKWDSRCLLQETKGDAAAAAAAAGHSFCPGFPLAEDLPSLLQQPLGWLG
jgi:hypothetical protein